MNILSDRILSLEESQTIAMARKSRELIDNGVDIISLSLGEPDFDTPDFIKEAAKKAIDDNFSHYTPVPGLGELRNAISTKFKRESSHATLRCAAIVATSHMNNKDYKKPL